VDYLRDLLQELADVAEFTRDGREAFMKSRQIQKAVIKSYENIGEIVKRIPSNIRDANPQVSWATLAGFRDFLIHNYDRIVLDNVWAAVEDLPVLKASVETILKDLEANDDE
jgi:uncharacterized protein with HEPN domain